MKNTVYTANLPENLKEYGINSKEITLLITEVDQMFTKMVEDKLDDYFEYNPKMMELMTNLHKWSEEHYGTFIKEKGKRTKKSKK